MYPPPADDDLGPSKSSGSCSISEGHSAAMVESGVEGPWASNCEKADPATSDSWTDETDGT